MAQPNIVGVTTIYGKTDVLSVTTVATAITSNSAASGEVYKINNVIVSNIDGTNDATIDIYIFRAAVAYYVAKTITVPANASLVALSKETALYLEEGDDLYCLASADGDLQAVCSYEIIS